MRIAHLITRMIVGGAQENTLYNCLDLAADFGDEVLLLTGPDTGPEGDLLKDRVLPGVQVSYVPTLRRSIKPLIEYAAYRELRKRIREFRPDVVHTHSAKAGILGRLAASAERVAAVVHTVHGAPFHPYQPWYARSVYRWCEWYAARHCHHLISVADAMTELMVKAGVAPREKFTTIYSGMEVEPFVNANRDRAATRAAFDLGSEEIVIGKIARLFHLKGHDDLIAAATEVVKAQPQVRFLLVGDGPLRGKLEAEIDARGLRSFFRFAGLVPPAQVPALVGAMDVLVHTSLREGLARALPQALLAGKPAVSYDIDGAREVVITGETGVLLAPRDVAGLARALMELSKDASLRRRLGAEGQRRCLERFPHQTMTRKIRELYEKLLAKPR